MARPDMFRLTDLEGKGAGLVAVEDISPGTLLISEPPVLRVTIMDGDLSPGASKDVSRQFSGMEEDQRKVVMSLANSYDDNNEILGIFRTNAMIISSSEAAVFPWVCRANHSCVPNCNYHHDSQTGLQHLYSATRILQGEELTVSYLPDNMLGCRAARQSHLMKSHRYPVTHLPVMITCTRHYHNITCTLVLMYSRSDVLRFLCQCDLCGLQGDNLEIDEKRRKINLRRVG